jgi:16S rRNA (guanine(527)-N(7))-methyltransferase RsmG
MKLRTRPAERVWEEFVELVQPSKEQLTQFHKYADYLLECNQFFNITAITDLSGVVRQHFQDSLALAKFTDMTKVSVIADIGTGGGFPGVPLKIMFPHLKVILIEVTKKKQDFLADVMKILGLTDVTVCGLDWRTFLRNANYPIDMFVTRASIDGLELIRMFKPACLYNKATLVYWASKDWEPQPKVKPFITRIESYKLGAKERRLVYMHLPQP